MCWGKKKYIYFLDGKQLSPVFVVQIRGSPGEVKARTSFLSCSCVGAVHSLLEPCTKTWMLPPVLNTSTRDCSNIEVLSKELLLLCASPGQHLLHHQRWGEVLFLANTGILILFLDFGYCIWIPAPKLCICPGMSFTETISRIESSWWFIPP